MGRSIRITESDQIYSVTNRTIEGRHFFAPRPEINALILACLGRALHRCGVELFAFIFMSNHFHILVRAPKENLHEFMGYFTGRLAWEVNRYHNRRGPLFGGRYHAVPVLDDEALLQQYVYIAANPLAAGLETSLGWPGISSYASELSARPLVGHWLDREALRRMRRRDRAARPQEATVPYTIPITPLPRLAELTDAQRVEVLREAVVAREAEILERRATEGKHALLGAAEIVARGPEHRPATEPCSPQPRCHTECPNTRRAYLETVREVTSAYRRAMKRWRACQDGIVFPDGTIPPGWNRVVRSARVGAS